MKRTLLFALTWFFPIFALGQSHAVSSRPPWIMGEAPSWTVGELPQINLQGNLLRVVFSQSNSPEAAEKDGDSQIVSFLLSRAGVSISSKEKYTIEEENTSTSKNGRIKTNGVSNDHYSSKIVVNGQTFGRYCLLDKYVQYKGGRYYFAGLYLVADKDMSLASVPPITYGMDRGAWRSLIVPGWGQFYQGRTGAGIAFLGVEAALVGTTVFFQNKVNINKQRIDEATSIDVKQAYKQRYDSMSMYRNIAAGASLAWYAFNAVDAFTSKKGRLYYTVAYGNGFISFSPAPVLIPETGDTGVGLAFNYRF
jgi:hypothetical protein